MLFMLLAAAPSGAFAAENEKVREMPLKFDRYELSVLYDATGYFTLSVFEKSADGAEKETVYGLRRAAMYLPPGYKSGEWMLFWGEQPPVYEGGGFSAVSKDPWLVSSAGGAWRVARVPHTSGKNGIYTLLRVQPGRDGSPELVYLNGDGEEDVNSPDGWAADSKLVLNPEKPVRVRRVKFVVR
ncbi:MAG: hypothetical protein A2049_10340 [Elusimicrobia bacterium GWA2_62_23]|nr:MAG: hypothetical protein A2049_10340 [Elusimicrobia bacterium GWA2_62_23]OGR66515.1 MAG: hypothetical protein A2179_04680 [Elusimicrobia bacterium GWC2_63_65]